MLVVSLAQAGLFFWFGLVVWRDVGYEVRKRSYLFGRCYKVSILDLVPVFPEIGKLLKNLHGRMTRVCEVELALNVDRFCIKEVLMLPLPIVPCLNFT